jgi:hypothetical protein
MENEPDYVTQSREFSERLNKAIELMVARRAKVSLPTVRRWMRGQTCPHPLMQETLFRALERDE